MAKPLATYRLQFRNDMTFRKAMDLLPYLKALGISHLYASPIFQATSGSSHGYDVTDPTLIDPELGGRDGFIRLAEALKAEGMGLLLDIVPNHMAASLENAWWRDVIEWGHASRHARAFDIDWEQRLTLPFLGTSFEQALEAGEVRLVAEKEKGFIALSCSGQNYPLNPSTYAALFRERSGDPADTISLLSKQASAEAEEIFHAAMRALMAGPDGEALDRHLQELSGDLQRLGEIHDLQNYRLMDWRAAAHGLSYRRFFEIAGLVGLRVEDPEVFEKVHHAVFKLIDAGLIDGLRIDHIDGLADPLAYLTRLRERIGPDTYLVVEKILGADEALPRDWPVDGTTGYEFVTALGGLLAHAPGVARLDEAYQALLPEAKDTESGMADARRLMMRVNFAGEMQALARMAQSLLARQDPEAPDLDDVRQGLEHLLLAFPVYRTYGTAEGMPEEGQTRLEQIAARCCATLDDREKGVVRALVTLLTASSPAEATGDFRIRFQQLSGPLMAKSIEDTFFYRHHAFIAFNEVGGEVWSQGRETPDFHRTMIRRATLEPLTMNATATHDTKRGEDARARLLALSEDPQRWIDGVRRWQPMLRQLMREAGCTIFPEPEMEWLIFQALAGLWPESAADQEEDLMKTMVLRLQAFLEKAAREAKLSSNWNDVNEPYETALKSAAGLLLGPGGGAFRTDFTETLQPFIAAGRLNALTQTILKLTAPGVPDIYQGSEQADFSLVDPDNRRPPDFGRLMGDLLRDEADQPLDFNGMSMTGGRLKQAVIARLLRLRQHFPALFLSGTYEPLVIDGENRSHLLAFLRRHEGCSLIVAVPLKTLCLERGECAEPGNGRTRIVLPDALLERSVLDLFTGRRIHFPERDGLVSGFAAAGYSLLVDPGP